MLKLGWEDPHCSNCICQTFKEVLKAVSGRVGASMTSLLMEFRSLVASGQED
jgi:hypothetical protein